MQLLLCCRFLSLKQWSCRSDNFPTFDQYFARESEREKKTKKRKRRRGEKQQKKKEKRKIGERSFQLALLFIQTEKRKGIRSSTYVFATCRFCLLENMDFFIFPLFFWGGGGGWEEKQGGEGRTVFIELERLFPINLNRKKKPKRKRK